MIGEAVRVVEQIEREALAAGGVVLRYGFFGGPGTWYAPTARSASWCASAATRSSARARACTPSSTSTTPRRRPSPRSTRPPGVYNVVDDHPAPTAEWLPAFAAALGARPPRRVPALPVKLLGGRPLVDVAGEPRGREQRAREAALRVDTRPGSWRTAFRDP